MVGVDLGMVFPLFRKIIQSEDCGHGADWDTSATIDALGGIDVELSFGCELVFVLARMNAVDRASIHTSGIFGSNTRFSDHIRHDCGPPQG
jgi:hypothetical protein